MPVGNRAKKVDQDRKQAQYPELEVVPLTLGISLEPVQQAQKQKRHDRYYISWAVAVASLPQSVACVKRKIQYESRRDEQGLRPVSAKQ